MSMAVGQMCMETWQHLLYFIKFHLISRICLLKVPQFTFVFILCALLHPPDDFSRICHICYLSAWLSNHCAQQLLNHKIIKLARYICRRHIFPRKLERESDSFVLGTSSACLRKSFRPYESNAGRTVLLSLLTLAALFWLLLGDRSHHQQNSPFNLVPGSRPVRW